MIIVSVIWLPVNLVQWDTRRFVLTNRRSMRMQGLLRKSTFDSSLEQINDIAIGETTLGRMLGYSSLTLYTASDQANETYNSCSMASVQEGRARCQGGYPPGPPLTELPEGFVVQGGTNEALDARRRQDPGRAGGHDGHTQAPNTEPECSSAASAPPSVAEPDSWQSRA